MTYLLLMVLAQAPQTTIQHVQRHIEVVERKLDRLIDEERRSHVEVAAKLDRIEKAKPAAKPVVKTAVKMVKAKR